MATGMTMAATATRTGIRMTEQAALYKLLAWLSPSYPVGAYTYSHGLEHAVEAGLVSTATEAEAWLCDVVEFGAGHADAVLLAAAHRAAADGQREALRETAELAAAFAGTRELALEAHAQGAAFLKITSEAWHTPALDMLAECWDGPYAYPVVVGCAAAGHGIALEDAIAGYLHAFAANLVSAAVRLVPLGQTDGQRITAALQPVALRAARKALDTGPEQISNASWMSELCSMRHETQHTRLFRS